MSEPTIVKEDRIDRHEGVDAYGLFTEFIRFKRETGQFYSQVQTFLVDNYVYVYQRPVGMKKGRWETSPFSSHEEAREQLRSLTAKAESTEIVAVMRGVPTLVQLTESDIEAMKNGGKPSARFDGATRNTRLFGKVDDSTKYEDMP